MSGAFESECNNAIREIVSYNFFIFKGNKNVWAVCTVQTNLIDGIFFSLENFLFFHVKK
jgi:hypothetical protein